MKKTFFCTLGFMIFIFTACTFFSNYNSKRSEPVEIVIPGMVKVKGSTQMGNAEYGGMFVEGRCVVIKDFYISDHEVTQKEYEDAMKTNPSKKYKAPKRPVDSISWYDALVYCNTLSIKEELEPCYTIQGSTNPADWQAFSKDEWNKVVCNFDANGYRLPTITEWEYAARGGNPMSTDAFPGICYQADEKEQQKYMAFMGTDSSSPWNVKSKMPNSLQLYDMCGNIDEWCWDWYRSSIDANTPEIGNTIDISVTDFRRYTKGGSYKASKGSCVISWSRPRDPTEDGAEIGFRVVRTKP